MSSASNGKSAQSVAIAGRSGSVDKTVGKSGSMDKGSMDKGSMDKGSMDKGVKGKSGAKKPMTPEQQKHVMIIGVVCVVVLGMGALIYAYFSKPAVDPNPRLNAGPEKLVPYVGTSDFDKLPFDRKMLYIKELADKKKEIEEMHKEGKLSDSQLREVLSIIWIGKRFKHIDHYLSLGALDRKDFLDKELDEDEWEKHNPKPKGTIERDKKRTESIIQTFPTEARAEIDAYHRAMKDREKERAHERRQVAKEAAANKHTTPRPTTRPTERPGTATPAVVKPGAATPK